MINAALATLLAERKESFVATLMDAAKQIKGTIYESMSNKQLSQMGSMIADNVIAHFAGSQPIEVFGSQISLQRVRDPNYTPQSIQGIISAIDTALMAEINQAYPEQGPEREAVILAAKDMAFRDACACYNTYTLERERALRESTAEQTHLVEMLRELSSPIIPVHDSILVLPVVGGIDTRRAQIIMEDLLAAIVDRQADMVIIDITGVPVVDTAIANYFLQTTKAVNLLGAHTILVGIRAEVAQTLVGLELDLQRITVRANLQDGIAYALGLLGFHIAPFNEAAPAE